MNNYLPYVTLAAAVLALLFAALKAKSILKFSSGDEKMKKISFSIKKGANAYLKRQYTIVAVFFACMFVILCCMAAAGLLTWFVPFAFVTGGFFSGLSGFVGMKIATASNARTTNACKEGLNKGLRVAFSAGSVMGFTVVGLGLLDISIWFILLKFVFNLKASNITSAMLTFGMGASSMALFARVGGGIFTKAADVGADLVGKVEAGIPEDDPRNPAVIADNVGDNVGDVAGMGADLYESYVGSVISASALGVAAFGGDIKAMALPLVLAALGILCSIFGTFLVRTKEGASQKQLLGALSKGTNTSAVLIAVLACPLTKIILGSYKYYFAILAGLVAGVLIGQATEYFTSDSYRPTKKLADTSKTGSATIIIGGISLGMLSTVVPIVIIGACILVAYYVSGGGNEAGHGLYGIALAAVGMLSTLGITLATDAYGPVADNAGGIAEMSGQEPKVRERTDALDSLGNTTAATGKGFAIGSAALTALALIASYIDKIKEVASNSGKTVDAVFDLMNPVVLVGLFIGACLPFVFAAITMDSVGKAAQSVVVEVRRQFKSIKGLMDGKADPDYAKCVDLCTKASLKEMILPTIVAIITPITVGLILGYQGVVGLLAGATASGFLIAIFMSNSGGAWDNAKKHIESGVNGGKGSDCHKAAVVGDTVGDPFKDTSGPSINILIKLLSMVSIVFAALVFKVHLL
ncbi:MAG TPA: sodium-translocating pyrophosphatase [Ruminococcaceae bacterium]|nr:sodium-translocating pyrophosphatase [Oscillospiraceae bacterium]